jgi:hypothetical protein
MEPITIVLLCVVCALVGYEFVKFAFKKDTEAENRRRAASKLAGILRSYGLTKVPDFLEDYAVEDLSGMAKKIIELVKLFLSGEDAVTKEFEQVFEKCLAVKLTTESGRAYIAAKLTDAAKPADPSVVLDAPVAGVV